MADGEPSDAEPGLGRLDVVLGLSHATALTLLAAPSLAIAFTSQETLKSLQPSTGVFGVIGTVGCALSVGALALRARTPRKRALEPRDYPPLIVLAWLLSVVVGFAVAFATRERLLATPTGGVTAIAGYVWLLGRARPDLRWLARLGWGVLIHAAAFAASFVGAMGLFALLGPSDLLLVLAPPLFLAPPCAAAYFVSRWIVGRAAPSVVRDDVALREAD